MKDIFLVQNRCCLSMDCLACAEDLRSKTYASTHPVTSSFEGNRLLLISGQKPVGSLVGPLVGELKNDAFRGSVAVFRDFEATRGCYQQMAIDI